MSGVNTDASLASGGRGLETYYRAGWSWTLGPAPLRLQLSPDFQYVQNPGFNRDRGPVRFYAVRLHLEY